MKRPFSLFLMGLFASLLTQAQNISLLNPGSSWKYLSDGSNQGTAWQALSFNDASWPSGNAQLGYGDGDEITVIPYGPNTNNRYITYYFRKTFSVTDPSAYSSLLLGLLRDDGAVVYLNGTEVMRSNLPSGSITYLTPASVVVSGSNETTYFTSTPATSLLIPGTNCIAVEVHQIDPTNVDVSFDLSLEAIPSLTCDVPTGLSASSIKSVSAVLSWSASSNASAYHVQYRKSGNSTWKDTTVINTTVSISKIASSSTYEWQVQSICSAGNSVYSNPAFFTTLFNCKKPLFLPVSNLSSSSATFNWTAVNGSVGYTLQYRKTGTTAWISSTSLTTSLTVSSLLSGISYEWRVRTQCSTNNSSYSGISTFTTLTSTCNTPSDPVLAGIQNTAATLSWNTVPGVTGYSLQYRPSGGAWTILSTSSNTITVTNLSTGITYEWQVQSVCTGGNSAFTASLFFTIPASGTDTLINTNANGWKYLDNGSNQGSSWQSIAFNDNSWLSGQAELGYGDGDEKTLVGYGPDANNKFITTYFRKTFTVSNPLAYASLRLGVVRDDGIVVYINGTEVYRNNMPSGIASNNTLALANMLNADEYSWYTAALDPTVLVAGNNVIAIEVHQQFVSSADLSFNCRLYASGPSLPVLVTRGAYLQKVTPSSITVRWRTDIETSSLVKFGTSLLYGNQVSDNTITKEHMVILNGLSSNTNHYYTIGSTLEVYQGDTNNTFITAPVSGSISPVRIWVTGDFGNGSSSQDNVRNAYMNYPAANNTNLWIWLGDNAYNSGTDAEYQSYVFNKYPVQFKRFPMHPALGNHDYGNAGYQSTSALGTAFPYFSNFSLFTAGEGGGVPSNTPKYYSYNYANIHLIALDSYGAYNNTTSPMYTWLQSDLAANTQRWTIVYFHHPPYTKGTHNSDTESELVAMRTNIVPLLESYHVDLVLCGHSHINERSYLIKGYFGLANTFNASMKVSTATNTFTKTAPFDGTIYAVCGTSGQNPGTIQSGYPMPCMYFNNNTQNCSMVLDVAGDNLSLKYLTSSGTIADQITITKSGQRMTEPDKQTNLTAYYNQEENSLILDYYLNEEGPVQISLYTMLGASVGAGFPLKNEGVGFYSVAMPLSSTPADGIYILRMNTKTTSITQKIFISR